MECVCDPDVEYIELCGFDEATRLGFAPGFMVEAKKRVAKDLKVVLSDVTGDATLSCEIRVVNLTSMG